MFRELDDRYSEGQTLANMGILYLQQGDEENAIALWQNAFSQLPPDLEKSQQVKQWLQSLQESNPELAQKLNPQTANRTLVLVGGAILAIAIALFLIFSR
jgi:tetratricopeptide (TPR) repeat protein